MRFLIHDVTGSHGDVLRIKEKWRNLKKEYAESDRVDGFLSHSLKIGFLSYFLGVMRYCLGIDNNKFSYGL